MRPGITNLSDDDEDNDDDDDEGDDDDLSDIPSIPVPLEVAPHRTDTRDGFSHGHNALPSGVAIDVPQHQHSVRTATMSSSHLLASSAATATSSPAASPPSRHLQSRHGKMEKSFVTFFLNHPHLRPAGPDGASDPANDSLLLRSMASLHQIPEVSRRLSRQASRCLGQHVFAHAIVMCMCCCVWLQEPSMSASALRYPSHLMQLSQSNMHASVRGPLDVLMHGWLAWVSLLVGLVG